MNGEIKEEPTFNQFDTLDSQNLVLGDDMALSPRLTILYHPQLRRVGEQATISSLLAYVPLEISRKVPKFSHPGSSQSKPLNDPFVSRKPVTVTRQADEFLTIEPANGVHLQIEGQKIEYPIDIPMVALRTGVILILSKRVVLLLHLVSQQERAPLPGMIGESDGICQVRRHIARVADLEVPVLIRGETGVGKELVAKSIHSASRRSQAAYRAINMATIQPGTGASMLFGHMRGAFTGATSRQLGLFLEADHGTLFMDEIGDTPQTIQPMLLRTLSENTIIPVGGAEEIPIDVRTIAATDVDIEQGTEDGTFRAALLHRLSGFEIRIPPLRERRVDIPRLAVHFLEKVLIEVGESARLTPPEEERLLWFPPALMLKLYHHDLLGNVRQLYNAVRQLVISNRGHGALRFDQQTKRVLDENPEPKPTLRKARGQKGSSAARSPVRRPNRAITDDEIYDALEANNWLVGPAADSLCMPRSTFYGRMERHPRIRKAIDLSRAEIEAALKACRGDLTRTAQRLSVSPRGLRLRLTVLGIRLEDYQ